jgi:hypothetical protein
MNKRFAGGNGEALKGKTFKYPVTVITNSTVREIDRNGTVTLMDNRFIRSTVKVNNVVLAQVASNNGLYEKLLEGGATVEKVGDAKRVRNLRGAVTDGANIALAIDEKAMLNANNAAIANPPTDVDYW